MFIILAILTALPTIMETRSCGEVTTIMPSTGRDWNTVSGYVARAGRHIDEQEVYVLPYNVRPELLDGLRDDRTAVDDRVILVRQDQIDRDHLYAAFAACRDDALLAALELVVHAEGLGDGRTGNVGIQHAARCSPCASCRPPSSRSAGSCLRRPCRKQHRSPCGRSQPC